MIRVLIFALLIALEFSLDLYTRLEPAYSNDGYWWVQDMSVNLWKLLAVSLLYIKTPLPIAAGDWKRLIEKQCYLFGIVWWGWDVVECLVDLVGLGDRFSHTWFELAVVWIALAFIGRNYNKWKNG